MSGTIQEQPQRRPLLKPLSDIHSVAVINLDDIGDLVMTSAFLRELRRNLPGSHISLAINPKYRNLVELCPYVDRVIGVPVQKRYGGWGEIGHAAALLNHARREWWEEQYDLALLPRYGPDVHDARVLAWLTRAAWRIGFDEPTFRTVRFNNLGLSRPFLLNQRLPRGGVMHEALRHLTVLESVGGTVCRNDLELWIGGDDVRKARELLQKKQPDALIAICPAGRHPCKRWPVSRFATVIEQLLKSSPAIRFVLIGGPDDLDLTAPLRGRFGSRLLDLVGKLTLRETAAALQNCDLYVGCDTGPMHIAAAAGASIVEICGHPIGGDPAHENSPSRFGPWKAPAIVLQPPAAGPCTTHCISNQPHCILGISVDDVMDASVRLLERRFTTGPRAC